MIPIAIGMQIRPDISAAVFVFVASKHAEFTDTLSLSSVGKYNHVFSAGLIPIKRPSETLWSWKNDAVDCQKRRSKKREVNLKEKLKLVKFVRLQLVDFIEIFNTWTVLL